MLNSRAEVVGLVSWGLDGTGDNFLRTVDDIHTALAAAGITAASGPVDTAYAKAMNLYWNHHYTAAVPALRSVLDLDAGNPLARSTWPRRLRSPDRDLTSGSGCHDDLLARPPGNGCCHDWGRRGDPLSGGRIGAVPAPPRPRHLDPASRKGNADQRRLTLIVHGNTEGRAIRLAPPRCKRLIGAVPSDRLFDGLAVGTGTFPRLVRMVQTTCARDPLRTAHRRLQG